MLRDYLQPIDPIYIVKRDGSPTNPFVDIQETLKVTSGKVILTEVPNEFYKVRVEDTSGNVLVETQSPFPNSTQYRVDYRLGFVFFNSANEGKSFKFTYKGVGIIKIPYERVFTDDPSESLKDYLIRRFPPKTTNKTISFQFFKKPNNIERLIIRSPYSGIITNIFASCTKSGDSDTVLTIEKIKADDYANGNNSWSNILASNLVIKATKFVDDKSVRVSNSNIDANDIFRVKMVNYGGLEDLSVQIEYDLK